MGSTVEPLISLTQASRLLKISGSDLLEWWRRERLPIIRNPLRSRQVRLYERDVVQFIRDAEEEHPDDIAHAARSALAIERGAASCGVRDLSDSHRNGRR